MSKNNKEALLYLLPAAVLFLVFYYWRCCRTYI